MTSPMISGAEEMLRCTDKSDAPVGIVGFLRAVCLRMVVHELTHAQYQHELDHLEPSLGSAEESRTAKQSEEFLRRTGETARRSLDAAFKLAEEHLATQEMFACVGGLVTRLAGTVCEQLRVASKSLASAMTEAPDPETQHLLKDTAAAVERAAGTLGQLLFAHTLDDEELRSTSLRKLIQDVLSLWCGDELAAELATEVDDGIRVTCRPLSLKAAFLTLLQQASKEGVAAGRVSVNCQRVAGEVAIEFHLEESRALHESLPFTAELARRIITSHGGKLMMRAADETAGVVCRVILPGGDKKL